MITCKSCKYEIQTLSNFCPRCKSAIVFSDSEIKELYFLFSDAREKKDAEQVKEYAKILTAASHTDAEREYAIMLESGELFERDFDGAMKYFLSAAKKGDAYSAYRYSRLVSRGNEKASRFWLLYSAVLGCIDSYPLAAEYLSESGHETDANHFYRLAAVHDDIDSIVELAKRCYKGIGMPPSHEYAKWYMEKLRIPPLSALKLAYKLRQTKSSEPPSELYDKEPLLLRLREDALKLEFHEPYFKINEMLSFLGNTEAMTLHGTLLADGIGCKKNTDAAVDALTEAAVRGSAEAYVCLYTIFISDGYEKHDKELAFHYLESAGKLGDAEAYLKLGKIYEAGEIVKKDYILAEKYYLKAKDGGIEEGSVAALKIDAERKRVFEKGLALEKTEPEKAFRAFAIAAAMGHKHSPMKLANCYLRGLGVKADRGRAFMWYESAASGGDERAFYPLGLCYALGIGTNRDFKKAKENLKRAASLGSDGAKTALLKLYEKKKKHLSRALYSRAMRLLYNKKFDAALSAFNLSAELDMPKALFAVGTFYEFGISVPVDREKAMLCYAEAKSRGFTDENSNLKRTVLRLIR